MDPQKLIFVQKSELLNGLLRFSSLNKNLKETGFVDGFDTLRNRDKLLDFEEFVGHNGMDCLLQMET